MADIMFTAIAVFTLVSCIVFMRMCISDIAYIRRNWRYMSTVRRVVSTLAVTAVAIASTGLLVLVAIIVIKSG